MIFSHTARNIKVNAQSLSREGAVKTGPAQTASSLILAEHMADFRVSH